MSTTSARRSRARLAPPVPVTHGTPRRVLLLLAVLLGALAGMQTVAADSLTPTVWPPAGLAAGLYLTTPPRRRPHVLAALLGLLVLAHLLDGAGGGVSLGLGVSTVLGAVVTETLLVARRPDGRARLRDQGDVSRMIGAIAVGSAVAGAGWVTTLLLTGAPVESTWRVALAAGGAHAAAAVVLVPLFLDKLEFQALASTGERAVQLALTVGTTVAVFVPTDLPQLIFAVMPMFTWHAFRGSLRESMVVLVVVAVVSTTLTTAGLGPVAAAGALLDLPPEVSLGVLQLFLLDCGLILLPLSVMVTQQRVATACAEQERETMIRLVDAATGTAVVATAADGTVTLFNPGAAAVFGRRADEVVGCRPDALFAEEELRRHADAVGAAPVFADICRASVAQGVRDAHWRVRRGEEERILRMTLTAVPDSLGGLTGYLATAEDVTDRERAHRSLLATLEAEREAVERLSALERTKTELVATVSHELRTPITSILGFAEVLEDGDVGELTGPQRAVLTRISSNSRRLSALVEDLLMLSSVEEATVRLQVERLDLRDVVARASAAVVDCVPERSLDVALHLPPGPVELSGDAVKLERAVTNLVSNALKFTPDGGAVTVAVERGADEHVVVVSDTGIGIAQEEQAQLFTRFFRSAEANLRAIQGTGLGLSIVQAIVELHGGRVGVDSAPGVGTTVTVVLPLVMPSMVSPAVSPAVSSPLGAPASEPAGGGEGLAVLPT